MSKISVFIFALFMAFGLVGVSCKKDKDDTNSPEVRSVELLTTASPMGPFSLYNFETGATLDASQQQSDGWDFGLRLTTMIVNSGVSGPGGAGAIVINGVFDEIDEAPEGGYAVDAAGDLAVKDATWYDYNPVTRVFTPKAGVVFLFRTAKGKYAKMEIISAIPTDDAGVVVTPPTLPTKIKYSVRYVYQPNGTRKF